MSAIDKIIDVYNENVDDSEWVSEARAELAQLRARIDALENDIICAFCGTHYKSDDVPPQHYMTCEKSPLFQRIAEQARQLEAARNLIDICLSYFVNRFEEFDFDAFRESYGRDHSVKLTMDDLRAWLAANPAPQEDAAQ